MLNTGEGREGGFWDYEDLAGGTEEAENVRESKRVGSF